MGRVKELWQQERDEWIERRVSALQVEGYSVEEAADIAQNELEQEDEANGQFGVGA